MHRSGTVGGMIELDCETDFVARTEEYPRRAQGPHGIRGQVGSAGVTEVGADGAFLAAPYAGSTVDEVVKATERQDG